MTVVEVQALGTPQPHRFTREEYYQMGEAGLFRDHRVELIEGAIIDMSPQKDTHAVAILLILEALRQAMPGSLLRSQLPLTLNEETEPEPDISVVKGKPRDYLGSGKHPSTAMLVVEVSGSTLRFDRTDKASLYARAGVLDYWIVNLRDRCVEVHREPIADVDAKFGHRYSKVVTVKEGEKVSPLASAGAEISVGDLLP